MTIDEVRNLQVGDNIRLVESNGSLVAGVVVEKGYAAVKIKWTDDTVSSLYFDGTGSLYTRCKKVD